MADDERWKAQNQARWERFKEGWQRIHDRHSSPTGWRDVGFRQGPDGLCACPVCQVVRQMDGRKPETE